MSRVDAPLFARAEGFTRWLIAQVRGWPPVAVTLMGAALVAEARRLMAESALALASPPRRAEHLQRADEALARLRVWLPLTDDELLSAAARQDAAEQITEMGRMIGGWQRRTARRMAATRAR